MVAKSVPLSVRLSREDAEYIAGLKAGDAVTMSEKVRYLVKEARLKAERGETFEGVVEQTEDTLAPLKQALDRIEQDEGVRSALLRALIVALPRIMAELEAADVDGDPPVLESLTSLEAGAARRVKDLLDQLARLSVTQEAPTLDPSIMRNAIAEPLVELVDIIKANPNRGE
ncbi:MAG: hypothetical protein HWE25_06490 [Alphaproteobacteria bacterium]|nr:hypothetical protein [Alphaproteobacteria bacterium]